MIQLLLDRGANTGATDISRDTAVHLASEVGDRRGRGNAIPAGEGGRSDSLK